MLINNIFLIICLKLINENVNGQDLYKFAVENRIDYYVSLLAKFKETNMIKHNGFEVFESKLDFYKGNSDFTLKNVRNEYDFIIVGAGPAGCVLANRLTENPKWKVLLIEAGKPENILIRVPVLAAYFQSTDYNWGYTTEPEPGVCLGMEGQRCGFPRGKGVGGTSLINYMIYNRGNHRDFDRWAEAGNPGWSYNDVLPYFRKSEMANLKGLENSIFHNSTGPLSVEDVPHRSEIVHAFIKAAVEAGYPKVDYNGESQIGTSYVQANTLNGRRHSAAKAYIEPLNLKRPNLRIITNARVTKVNISPITKTAYGIEFVRNKKRFKVKASKEVILSAGAFNSPQLLMLSGVGPKDHLQDVNIPVIKDLPVGKTMYDHMSHFGPTFIVNTVNESLHTGNVVHVDVLREFLNGRGKLTTIGGVEALTFIKSKLSTEPDDFPDVELIFTFGSMASDEGSGIRKGMRVTQEVYDTVFKPLEDNNIDAFTVLPMLFHPKSKGYIQLQDKNPFHWPKIHPNFFSDLSDIEMLLDGIKESIRISEQPALKKLGVRLHNIPLPNCKQFPFGTDDYWRCSIRTLSATLHHQVSTCKMGPETDRTTVVNHELKVHGIKRLRVVDTSIIPQPPTCHTNAASFMIGEKASDMIRGDW